MLDFLHNYPLFANTYLGFLESPLLKGVWATPTSSLTLCIKAFPKIQVDVDLFSITT